MLRLGCSCNFAHSASVFVQDLFSGWWKRFILWIVSPLSGRSSLSYTHHCVMLSKTLSPHARTSCEAVAASSFRSSSVAAWPRADADCNSGTHLCCCSLLPRTGLDGALRADRGRGLPRRQSLGKSDWCLLASHLSGPSCVIFNHVSVTSMPPLWLASIRVLARDFRSGTVPVSPIISFVVVWLLASLFAQVLGSIACSILHAMLDVILPDKTKKVFRICTRRCMHG